MAFNARKEEKGSYIFKRERDTCLSNRKIEIVLRAKGVIWLGGAAKYRAETINAD